MVRGERNGTAATSTATRALLDADPAFAAVVARSPRWQPETPRPGDEAGHFSALVRSIVFQQLAGAAASAIHARLLVALGGTATPSGLRRLHEQGWRDAGVSGSKQRSLLDLAAKVDAGEVDLGRVHTMPDDEVVGHLTTVRGIGPWTAQMFLLFRLGRPDVWPTGDLGVRNGWAVVHDEPDPPTPTRLADLGEPLAPHRSTAAWYCWRALEVAAAGASAGRGGE